MREYLWVIFFGIAATFLYNFFACLLRAVGNSAAPLIFLGISAVLNIVLDLVCVLVFHWAWQELQRRLCLHNGYPVSGWGCTHWRVCRACVFPAATCVLIELS